MLVRASANPCPSQFRHMNDVVEISRAAHGASAPEHVLRFAGGVEKDPRRCGAPSAAEVAFAV
eukprot:4221577-Pyramimonas_sp.AAC.1